MRKLPIQFKSWLEFYREIKHLEEQLKEYPDGGKFYIQKPLNLQVHNRTYPIKEERENHEEFTFLELKNEVLNEILAEPIMSEKQVIMFYNGLLKMEHDAGYRMHKANPEFERVRDILLKLSNYDKP